MGLHDLSQLAKVLEKLEVDMWEVRGVLPKGRAREWWEELSVEYEEYIRLIKGLMEKSSLPIYSGDPMVWLGINKLRKKLLELEWQCKGKFKAGCGAGSSVLYIDSSKTVYPCAYIPMPMGSLDGKCLSEVISKGDTYEIFKNIRGNLKGRCGGCSYRRLCGGCRAVAMAIMEGIYEEDPRCKIDYRRES